jgi:hypothetical protein
MKRLTWFLAVVMLSGAGCEEYVLSLNPLCPDDACVSVPGLEGKWASDDQVWTVRSQDKSVYEVRVADMMSAARFEGRAWRLGDRTYLDLRPVKEAEDIPVPSLFAAHWLQASSFMQVKLEGDALSLLRMNAGELKKTLEEKPDLIKHTIQGDNVLLLDDGPGLAQFVQAQADVNGLWQEHGEFVRCAPLYSAEDLIRPEGLSGHWHDPNDTYTIRIDMRPEAKHFRIQVTSGSEERLTFSAHAFKRQGLLFMGFFWGTEDMRSREMATRMPDLYTLVDLKKDCLNMNFLDFIEVKELMAHPEMAEEIQAKPETRLIPIKP